MGWKQISQIAKRQNFKTFSICLVKEDSGEFFRVCLSVGKNVENARLRWKEKRQKKKKILSRPVTFWDFYQRSGERRGSSLLIMLLEGELNILNEFVYTFYWGCSLRRALFTSHLPCFIRVCWIPFHHTILSVTISDRTKRGSRLLSVT